MVVDQHPAHRRGRCTARRASRRCREYIPRRIGEILGALRARGAPRSAGCWRWRGCAPAPSPARSRASWRWWCSPRSRASGLPIDTRYAFLAAAILCVFAGAAVCGWMELPRGDPHRRWWMAAAAVAVVALAASIPSQYRTDHHELNALARQQRIQNELDRAGARGAITTRCEPIGVTNHAPVPLLALWLEAPPSEIANLQAQRRSRTAPSWTPPTRKSRRTTSSTATTPTSRSACPPASSRSTPTARGGSFSGVRTRGAGRDRPRGQARLPNALGRWASVPTGEQWTVHPPSRLHSRPPIAARDSGSGTPAAPAGDRLRLLPSGPDLVHKPTPRGTRTIDAPNGGATGANAPRRGIQPR